MIPLSYLLAVSQPWLSQDARFICYRWWRNSSLGCPSSGRYLVCGVVPVFWAVVDDFGSLVRVTY